MAKATRPAIAQMVADWLGVPEDKIHLAQADTDEVAIGRGTYASRSMMIGGSALRAAADEVIERGKRFAAHFMEADAADIAFADGAFTIAGTDRSMPIEQVARMSFIPVGLPSALGVGLQGAGAFSSDVSSFPNGCHICELEIDPETGAVVDRPLYGRRRCRHRHQSADWRRGRSRAASPRARARRCSRKSSTTVIAASC